MTPEQFAYWLQGYAELTEEAPTPEQWKSIKEHLQTVFRKVTPPVIQDKRVSPLNPISPSWPEISPNPYKPYITCDTATGLVELVKKTAVEKDKEAQIGTTLTCSADEPARETAVR